LFAGCDSLFVGNENGCLSETRMGFLLVWVEFESESDCSQSQCLSCPGFVCLAQGLVCLAQGLGVASSLVSSAIPLVDV
jgi:hypothetical protein